MKKPKTFKVFLFVSLFLALLLSFFVFKVTKYYYQTVPSYYKYSTNKEDSSFAPVTEEFSGETVAFKLSSIGELVTKEYSFTHVETYKSSRTIGKTKVPLTENHYIYSYDGTIKAGVNFVGSEVQVDEKDKIINISLPKAEILSSEIDEDSYKIYDEKNNIFNPLRVSAIAESLSNLIECERKNAIDEGILEDAEKNAKFLIKNFLQSTSIPDNYKIKIEFV